MISENSDVEAGIKLDTDYFNTIVEGDVDKATAMLASNYKGYGPGGNDSSYVQQVNESWKKGNAMQTNRKSTFVLFVVKAYPSSLRHKKCT